MKTSNTLQNSKKRDQISDMDKHTDVQGFGSLFNEILGIMGTENISMKEDDPYEVLIPKETQFRSSPQGVRRIAEPKIDQIKMENALVLKDIPSGISDENLLKDFSPIVHKITEIARSKNGTVSMEERLENANFEYHEEVVEKVLKRCFKVPHLTLRFFNWFRLGKGFRPTVGPCNTMIHLAGEAKQFGLVKEFVDEMENSSCEKSAKTWTVLLSHYAKANSIGRAYDRHLFDTDLWVRENGEG